MFTRTMVYGHICYLLFFLLDLFARYMLNLNFVQIQISNTTFFFKYNFFFFSKS